MNVRVLSGVVKDDLGLGRFPVTFLCVSDIDSSMSVEECRHAFEVTKAFCSLYGDQTIFIQATTDQPIDNAPRQHCLAIANALADRAEGQRTIGLYRSPTENNPADFELVKPGTAFAGRHTIPFSSFSFVY
ncbi:MAG: hypothetical protein HZB70_04160 [Candidatus Berkelbacteria bacterium]|nr:MAG: hypothetical protein HZB70_04160 [Candidatus Berkelbacteria bacterium]QQG51508.1 MAG: hypothetical protein HY845_03030 [Candidatus Berkelbacteria bacterium]